jgi:hypothetical protein
VNTHAMMSGVLRKVPVECPERSASGITPHNSYLDQNFRTDKFVRLFTFPS